jgi:hypothetical protein
MLRGSSVLLRRSIKHFAAVIEVIASAEMSSWEIDAHAYTDDSIQRLAEMATQIRSAMPEGASDILVTKIMLGVFGCVPAFDTYFKKGFGVSTFGRKSLVKVGRFTRTILRSSSRIAYLPSISQAAMKRPGSTRVQRSSTWSSSLRAVCERKALARLGLQEVVGVPATS